MEGAPDTDNPSAATSEPQAASSSGPGASSPSAPGPDSSCPSVPGSQGSSGAREKVQQAGASAGKEPVCLLVLGMAGSGKTSLLRRLDAHLNVRRPHFTINLDPAVDSVPYVTYIDIRDTVNYKEVGTFAQYPLKIVMSFKTESHCYMTASAYPTIRPCFSLGRNCCDYFELKEVLT